MERQWPPDRQAYFLNPNVSNSLQMNPGWLSLNQTQPSLGERSHGLATVHPTLEQSTANRGNPRFARRAFKERKRTGTRIDCFLDYPRANINFKDLFFHFYALL